MANPVFREGRDGTVWPGQEVSRHLRRRPFHGLCCAVVGDVIGGPALLPADANLYDGAAIPKPVTSDDDFEGWPGKPQCFVDAENKIGTTDSHVACGSLEGVAKNYYAGLVACDDNIGKVLSLLERRNLLNDTAILHTSDHGYFLGEWREIRQALHA